jgi:HEAT repeat protein
MEANTNLVGLRTLSEPSFPPVASEALALQSSGGRLYNIAPVDPQHPVERLLRRSLRNPDTEAHSQDATAAWNELRHLGTQAVPYLLSRLDTPDVLIRAKIEDLIDYLGTNSVPALIAGIDTAKNDEVARLCCYFLARFGDQPPLARGSGLHPRSVHSSNVAVGNRSHTIREDAIKAILPLIERQKTRAVAFYTLGHLRSREAFKPAMAALGDAKEIVRLRAAQALGRICSVDTARNRDRARPESAEGNVAPTEVREVVQKLIGTLDDEMWDVRYAAENALVAIGKPSLAPLRGACAKAGPRARPHIIAALARLGDRRALSLARSAMQADDPQVRAAIEKQLRDDLKRIERSR